MLSRVESYKKKAHADISMKLFKMFMSMSNWNIYHKPIEIGLIQDGGNKIQDGSHKKVRSGNEDFT